MLILLFGLSSQASSIIYSLAVIAALFNYAMPIALALVFPDNYVQGPFNYGKWSRPIFAWAFGTQIFLLVIESLPPSRQVTASTFNYSWVLTLAIILIAAITYIPLKSRFKGIPLDDIERWRTAARANGRFAAEDRE